MAIAVFLVSSSNVNWLYCGICPIYNTTWNCRSCELVPVVPQWIFRGCDLACHSYRQACVNISRKKNQWRNNFSSLVTWEPKVPHKVPLPQHSLTRKHREHLLDSQIRSEGENRHLTQTHHWKRRTTPLIVRVEFNRHACKNESGVLVLKPIILWCSHPQRRKSTWACWLAWMIIVSSTSFFTVWFWNFYEAAKRWIN